VSLAVVLGLMALAAWVMRRKGPGRLLGQASPFTVVARQPLGRSASLQVVTFGDRALVLGVTEQTVTLLAEGDAQDFPAPTSSGRKNGPGAKRTAPPGSTDVTSGSGPAWRETIEQLRERTVRRS
jgi:flagellar protein FliO/FliZ